jgi:hypothetical protein
LNEGDFHNGVRLAMGILERDFSQAYDPRMMLPTPKPSTATTQSDPPDEKLTQLRPSLYWDVPGELTTKSTGIRPMRFVGSPTKMTFVSIKTEDPRLEGTRVLVKEASPNAFAVEDDDKDEMKRTYPLMRGIKKLQFRYLKKAKDSSQTDQWLDRWDSVEIEDTRGIYPSQIEVILEVLGPTRLSFEGTFKFRTEIPLSGEINPSF